MAEEMITVKVTAYQKVEYIQYRRIPNHASINTSRW